MAADITYYTPSLQTNTHRGYREYTIETACLNITLTFATSPRNRDLAFDEGTRHIRVDVLDFHGNLDPYVFQDWVTTLEDHFDWFGMTKDRKVRFVKMRLKGQTRVRWQSVEEQLYRTHQPPIMDWEKMRLKLQEKYPRQFYH